MRAPSRRTLLAGCCCAAGALALSWPGCRRLSLDQPIEPKLRQPAANVPSAPHVDPRGWPSLFGPDLTSVSAETGLETTWGDAGPPEVWRSAVGAGYSSPVVVDGNLILLDRANDRERVSCLDADSGQPRWEYSWPTSFQCKYAYSSGPYGTPLIDGQLVNAAGAQGRLACINRADGSLVWQRDLASDLRLTEGLFGFGPGLATDERRLYVNAGGVASSAGVLALDKRTGQTLWKATDHAMAYTTPRLMTIHGHRLLLVLTESGLACLDRDSGHEHWTYPFHTKSIDSINAVTPAVQDDLVLLVAGPGPGAVCLRIHPDLSHSVVWKDRRVLDSQFNTLVHHAGHIYGFTARRQGGSIFKCLELATGKLRWEYPSDLDRGQALAVASVGRRSLTSPPAAEGRLILLGEHGLLTALALDPSRLQIIATTAKPLLASPCYSSPALHRGLLYLRNESTLLCLRLRP